MSYNANGGNGAPAQQSKTHDAPLKLSNAAPTRQGYKFEGWATNPSAASAQYQLGDIYTVNGNVTLYAVWRQDVEKRLIPERSPSTPIDGTKSERERTARTSSLMTDISSDHWAAEFIGDLVARGIISGYPMPDGTLEFRPANDITRAELIKLIVDALKLDLIKDYDGSAFADWDEAPDWAKPYIAAAVDTDIILGAQEGSKLYIHASNNITREEMIAIAARALKIDTAASESTTPDFGSVSGWAVSEAAFAVENGMINLDADGNLNPRSNAKRDEAAMTLFKLIEYREYKK
jgi:uncharacterized repeat protein (TIGR02543 family)